MGLGGKSYVLLIFLRERLGVDKICYLGSFFFQFPSRFVRSLLGSDGGDRGSGRVVSPRPQYSLQQ